MGSTDSLNSYSLLKMKMKKIENSKKSEVKKETLDSDAHSSASTPTVPSSQKNDVVDPDIPVHTYGDFYCTICDAHMNSQGMWNSHITGKKHQKNVNRSVPDTKYEDLNVESSLKYEIRNVKDAIVGLSYIQEIRRKEPGVPPLFTCFLCHANCATATMIIEHVISLKHRLNYIRANSPDDHELLEATDLKKVQMEPLVAEMAHKLEKKFGSGTVKVKQEKGKPSSWPSKKPITYCDDDDVDHDVDENMDRIKKPRKKNPYVWKAMDYHRRDNLKDVKDCRDIIQERRKRADISDEEEDTYVRRNPVNRTVYNHSKRQRSLSPYFPKSPRMEKAHSRTSHHTPPEDHYNYSQYNHSTFSCSSPQGLMKKNVLNSRNSTHRPVYEHSHSRYQIEEKESSLSNHSLPNETTNMESDSSVDLLKEFVLKLYALPSEAFLKLVLYRLDTIEVKRIEELVLLSKVINKAQTVICDKLPADIEAAVKRKMFRNGDSSLQKMSTAPATNEVAQSSTENQCLPSGSNFSYIRNLVNLVNGKDPAPPVTQIEASHYSTPSYSAATHGNNDPSYQTSYVAPSNETQSYSTTSNIPGLTLAEDNRQAYASSFSPYQSQYFNPSANPSVNYSQYKY